MKALPPSPPEGALPREDAFVLYGLTRALRLLQEENGPDMRDGTAALIEVICERAGALAHRLEALDAASAPLAAAVAGDVTGTAQIEGAPDLVVLPGRSQDGLPLLPDAA